MYSLSKGFSVLCCVLLMSVIMGCQSTTGKTAGQTASDASISAAVKAKLTSDRVSNFPRIDVDTDRGIVTLSGSVETKAQQAQAERLAQEVEGVRRVNNNLQIQHSPPAGKPPIQTHDTKKSGQGEKESSPAQVARTIQGEVLRIDGGNYFVKGQDGKEVRLYTDMMTMQIEQIQSGDRIHAEVDQNNYAVLLLLSQRPNTIGK